MTSLPTISVVTPSLNQRRFIEDALRSVADQRYPKLEHVVVDGGSTDGTLELIRAHETSLAAWTSEPDRGQAHAVNKGLAMTTGTVVGVLCSDDVYLPGSLEAVGAHFEENPSCQWLCGDSLFFGNGFRTRLVRARVPKSAAHALSWAYRAPQPGMFWRRELVAGGFDERWRYCFDHELYVRLLLAGRRCERLPLPVAGYRLHAASKTVAEPEGFEREFDAIAELYAPRLHGPARRRVEATLALRRSGQASAAGSPRKALRLLRAAATTDPRSVYRRPFWGYSRRALAAMARRGVREEAPGNR